MFLNKTIIIILFIICFILIFYVTNNFLKYKSVKYENFDNNYIPKIIVQTWKTKNVPLKYINDVKSIKKYNSDFQFLFFSDEEIDEFLKKYYPIYYESYLKLPVKIQKIDYFRYIAIYHYGGFYFDLDMRGMYPLNDLLDKECIFPVDQNLNSSSCSRKRIQEFCNGSSLKINYLLGQYGFGAKPNNQFIKALIDGIHNNIDKYVEEFETNKTHNYVYKTTGPDYVTSVYLNYKNKDDIHILLYDEPQYFGKYAKHNHYGTWK
jgi:mannosyltransferase OCH1-like enzyme